MSEQKYNNINISGAGKIDGGVYNNIGISGSCKVLSDIKANRISVSGSTSFLGDVECETLTISGVSKIEGKLKVNSARISGAFRGLEAEGSHLRIFGGVVFDDDINFEIVEIDASMYSELRFKNIYGDQIIIHGNKYVIVEEIEATKIEIEGVKARRISGDNIIIGKNCVIGVVEYSKSLELDRQARIENIVRL